ncbi:MAG: hypothetical protein IPP06_15845 [Saprospiraceae bacterium]|nr:hypothetical protein [Candidatus Vicinibacter affinis]
MHNESIDISSIKALVSAAKLDDAIKLMIQKGKEEKNGILERFGLQFSSRLNALSKRIIENSASFSEMTQSRDDISARVLDIIMRYENGTLEDLKNTEEYKHLPTPKEAGSNSAEVKYYEFLHTAKRFWWVYVGFVIFLGFIIFTAIKIKREADRSLDEFTKAREEKKQVYPGNDCEIQAKHSGLDLKEEPVSLGISPTVGKIPSNAWAKVEEIVVLRNVHGKHVFYKVKVPNSTQYGWVEESSFISNKTGNCIPH